MEKIHGLNDQVRQNSIVESTLLCSKYSITNKRVAFGRLKVIITFEVKGGNSLKKMNVSKSFLDLIFL